MAGVVDIERFAAPVAREDALDLEGKDIGDRGRAFERVQVELDRLELYTAEVAHQILADDRRRSAGFTSDDGGERGPLGLVGAVVDDPGEDPVAVGHDLARADD